MLNGNVGGIRTDHGRMGVPNKSMAIMNAVNSSNVLVTGSFTDRVIGNILLSEQEFVGLQDGRVHSW